jgi:hypothetical protein
MSNVWSQRNLCLLPEGSDQSGPALAAPQLSLGLPTQVGNIFGTEAGQRVAFEMAPDVFDRVEFRGVSRQACQSDAAVRSLDVPLHHPTAVDGQTVPDHQQFARNLTAEMAQKLHRLTAFDAAAIEAKVKLPPSDARDNGEFAPSVTENQLRGLASWGQVRTTLGRSDKPLSSTKTRVHPSLRDFFLARAKCVSSNVQSPLHPVAPPCQPGAGGSSPFDPTPATHGFLLTTLCSTDWFYAQFHTHLAGLTSQLLLGQPVAYGGEVRNRPYFPAVVPRICLILLTIQAKTA